MRLLIGAAAVGLLGLAGLRLKPGVRAQQKAVIVTVALRCYQDSMHFSVSPWTAPVPRNGAVDWELSQSADADSLVVDAKDATHWPFQNGFRYRGAKGKPAQGRQMKPNAQSKKPYRYLVTLTCNNTDSTQPPRTVIIDPEMIIN